MKIIKDNSQKEYKVKCKYCRSKFSFSPIEIIYYLGNIKEVECPACKRQNSIMKSFWFYQTY
jgi:DNA-directed RNA polymerase subunit RPC12/RpoP